MQSQCVDNRFCHPTTLQDTTSGLCGSLHWSESEKFQTSTGFGSGEGTTNVELALTGDRHSNRFQTDDFPRNRNLHEESRLSAEIRNDYEDDDGVVLDDIDRLSDVGSSLFGYPTSTDDDDQVSSVEMSCRDLSRLESDKSDRCFRHRFDEENQFSHHSTPDQLERDRQKEPYDLLAFKDLNDEQEKFLRILTTNDNFQEIAECSGCGKPILDRFLLKVQDKPWHSKCLECKVCKTKLTSSCFARSGDVYCKDDFLKTFASKCAACGKTIPSTEIVRRASNNVYHLDCFRCCVCSMKLDTGDQFYLLEDRQLVCKSDYEGNGNTGEELDSNSKRPRTTINAKQLETLKSAYSHSSKPVRHVREQLSRETGLDVRVVQVWFQNRRAKAKRMKKEVVQPSWPGFRGFRKSHFDSESIQVFGQGANVRKRIYPGADDPAHGNRSPVVSSKKITSALRKPLPLQNNSMNNSISRFPNAEELLNSAAFCSDGRATPGGVLSKMQGFENKGAICFQAPFQALSYNSSTLNSLSSTASSPFLNLIEPIPNGMQYNSSAETDSRQLQRHCHVIDTSAGHSSLQHEVLSANAKTDAADSSSYYIPSDFCGSNSYFSSATATENRLIFDSIQNPKLLEYS